MDRITPMMMLMNDGLMMGPGCCGDDTVILSVKLQLPRTK